MNKSVSIKLYHGYGHRGNLVVYGHAFLHRATGSQRYSNNFFVNILYLLKLFMVRPYPFARVRLQFYGQYIDGQAAYDGFLKFEWAADREISAGWHPVQAAVLSAEGKVLAETAGDLYVPHITQYGFISDIDDTIMVSHSATIIRRLRELFIKNPRTRKTFPQVAAHYALLAGSHTDAAHPNPFFYVSSSEWNLYDYLVETFRFNRLPEGAFLLNQLKGWRDLIKTGKTGHEGKLMRVMRIIDAFPNQQFVLFGDNSQRDPAIYAAIAIKYPKNIGAVYIRNVRPGRAAETRQTLAEIAQQQIPVCLFRTSAEAIAHSRENGLIV